LEKGNTALSKSASKFPIENTDPYRRHRRCLYGGQRILGKAQYMNMEHLEAAAEDVSIAG